LNPIMVPIPAVRVIAMPNYSHDIALQSLLLPPVTVREMSGCLAAQPVRKITRAATLIYLWILTTVPG